MSETPPSSNDTGVSSAPIKPQQEHEWLHKLIGDWNFEGECVMGPGEPPVKSTGAVSVRSLGGIWILVEGVSDALDGTPVSSLITLGFDPAKGRFVGSFVAGCMTHLWTYDGTLDDAGKVLTLDTEGPSFTDNGTLDRYVDIFEIENDDHWTLKSRLLGEDGRWMEFMTAHYRRKT